MRRVLPIVLLLVATAAGAQPFITARDLDLTRILPPAPGDDSVQTKLELAEVLSIQSTRTAEMATRASADSEETPWRFSDVLGPRLTKDALPHTAALFARLHETEKAVVDAAKETYNRNRPYMLSDRVQPAAELSKSASYPSGHSTVGTLMGIVLANMVPEKRPEIMARAWEYGWNRVVAGVHYRSDVEAGRIAGSAIAAMLFARDDFRSEYDAARGELRAALGLPVEQTAARLAPPPQPAPSPTPASTDRCTSVSYYTNGTNGWGWYPAIVCVDAGAISIDEQRIESRGIRAQCTAAPFLAVGQSEHELWLAAGAEIFKLRANADVMRSLSAQIADALPSAPHGACNSPALRRFFRATGR